MNVAFRPSSWKPSVNVAVSETLVRAAAPMIAEDGSATVVTCGDAGTIVKHSVVLLVCVPGR